MIILYKSWNNPKKWPYIYTILVNAYNNEYLGIRNFHQTVTLLCKYLGLIISTGKYV